jgi:hypothetical protein
VSAKRPLPDRHPLANQIRSPAKGNHESAERSGTAYLSPGSRQPRRKAAASLLRLHLPSRWRHPCHGDRDRDVLSDESDLDGSFGGSSCAGKRCHPPDETTPGVARRVVSFRRSAVDTEVP